VAPIEAAALILDDVMRQLRPAGAFIALEDRQRRDLRMDAAAGLPDWFPVKHRRTPLHAQFPCTRAVISGRPQFVDSHHSEPTGWSADLAAELGGVGETVIAAPFEIAPELAPFSAVDERKA
jgi:hypothetical protein